MSQILGSTPSGDWVRRQKRVARLQTQYPHVGDMLAFYKSLLGQQGKLFRKTIRSRAFDVAVSSEQSQGQKVNVYLERLPRQPMDRAFMAFLKGLPEPSTEVLQAIAARLLKAPTSASRLLAAVVSRHPIDEVAAELECDTLPLEFFPRAFLQPMAEALVQCVGHGVRREVDGKTVCPYCGSPPQVSVLQDDADTRGKRTLLCSLCASAWSFSRSCCPQCSEQQAEQLQYHETEAWPHVRVEECRSCQTYIKAVDLRINGLAVPLVDELASVELDLWACEQGLVKLQRNVLGF